VDNVKFCVNFYKLSKIYLETFVQMSVTGKNSLKAEAKLTFHAAKFMHMF